MNELFRSTRLMVAVFVAIVGSSIMYWNHINRAVSDGNLCRNVEKHVVKMNTAPNGAVVNDPDGIVDNILDVCERKLSKSQANCVLKASSMDAVRACGR